MAVKKRIFGYAAILTLVLFILIYSFNVMLDQKREESLLDRVDDLFSDYEELQAILLLSDVAQDEKMTCLALESSLVYLNRIWETGRKIDTYQSLNEEFLNDPAYAKMKQKFNRGEIMYFSMLKKLKDECNVDKTVIQYFYKRPEECGNCDAQSFVLTDINKELNEELTIFAFDANIGGPAVGLLTTYYNMTEYPCMVIEEDMYCGLHNKDQLIGILCRYGNLSVCS